jgi:hypothetical protein
MSSPMDMVKEILDLTLVIDLQMDHHLSLSIQEIRKLKKLCLRPYRRDEYQFDLDHLLQTRNNLFYRSHMNIGFSITRLSEKMIGSLSDLGLHILVRLLKFFLSEKVSLLLLTKKQKEKVISSIEFFINPPARCVPLFAAMKEEVIYDTISEIWSTQRLSYDRNSHLYTFDGVQYNCQDISLVMFHQNK